MNAGGEKPDVTGISAGACPTSREEGGGASVEQGERQLELPMSTGTHAMRAEELEQPTEILSRTMESSAHEGADRTGTDTLGQRLRVAREARGMSRADAATRLRLPLRLISRLEGDDYEGLDQGLYLRGYLTSYAELVGLPFEEAQRTAAEHTRAVPLIATGTVSRSRYLFDRYSVSATYLILTGLIVVPAVWLATHGGLEQNLARTTSLDSPTTTIAVPMPASESAATENGAAENGAETGATASTQPPAAPAAEPPQNEQMPVVASMTPFAAQTPPPPAAAEEPASEPAAAAPGEHTLVLKLKSNSWVEITAKDGSKLEYSLLPAGSERTYTSSGPLSLRLGNADGAEVRIDGRSVDLAPYRRANVASLRVFTDHGTDPPTDF